MRFQSIAALAAVAPMLVAAGEPAVLKPVTPWTLDYAANSCRLLRNFGDKAAPTRLIFERSAPSASLSMIVISKALKAEPGKDNAVANFLPVEGLEFKHGRTTTVASGKEPAALWSWVGFIPELNFLSLSKAEIKRLMKEAKPGGLAEPRDLSKIISMRAESLANAAKVTAIRIQTPPSPPLVLETGTLGKAMAMMEECGRDQLKGWGLNPDVEERIVRPAWAPRPFAWFSSDDYPSDALQKGQRSLVEARLMIDATGKITDCVALSHFDAPSFQKVVCDKVRKRGKYRPAELADGTKVPSYTILRIAFDLPR